MDHLSSPLGDPGRYQTSASRLSQFEEMTETQPDRKLQITQLFSFLGFALLAVGLTACYILWDLEHALVVALGSVLGILSLLIGIMASGKGRLQYSIRSALLLMVVIAAMLTLHEYVFVNSDTAIRRIRSLGGDVKKEEMRNGSTHFYAEFIRQPILPRHLGHLRHLPNLTRLDLDYCQIGNEGLHYVGKLTDLEWLDIEDTGVSDEGIDNLITLQSLEQIIIDGNNITDKGLLKLSNISSLRSVRVRNTLITSDGIEQFNRILPNCRVNFD